MNNRNSASKNRAAAAQPSSGKQRFFGRWLSTLKLDSQSPKDEIAPESVEPLIEQTPPPDSERTVYKHVPQDLLEQARERGVISVPPPSYDESERTAVFAPPMELLRGLHGSERPRVVSDAPPYADALPPVVPAGPTLRPEAPPTLPPEALPEREHVDLEVSESEPPAAERPEAELSEPSVEWVSERPRRGRSLGWFILIVLLAFAAAYAYMHSGRNLLIPSSATKNG